MVVVLSCIDSVLLKHNIANDTIYISNPFYFVLYYSKFTYYLILNLKVRILYRFLQRFTILKYYKKPPCGHE